ncbi:MULTISPECIES: hypothetical protein [unclassified Rathayibacter]|uniref:hypothetical protein n=1 Tax=unclassified Rathayibacter TaxID=2609250 RepID=UPI00188C333E|nr:MULTISPECIES: hypothetical protein [unclassified Rathayibacter]MBF4461626.1 hypothetical protein [Rathayibacter sp. VKM Ac-2879]MBF4503037.1 hypothetical protein [Rathayibacter sp. VKM Ac-2878]
MIRTRAGGTLAILTIALALAGCSSSTIDIPAGAEPTMPAFDTPTGSASPSPTAAPGTTATVAPGAEATAGAPAKEQLDCATLLSLPTLSSALDVPGDFISASEPGDGCAWSMAGNPAAVTVQSTTGASAQSLDALKASGSVTVTGLGEQAFYTAPDPTIDPAATLAILDGDRLVVLRSFVGGQAALETLATDVLRGLG